MTTETLTTTNGEKQLIYSVKSNTPWQKIEVRSSNDMPTVWENHIQRYGSLVTLKGWKEDVLCIPKDEEINLDKRLEFSVTTSYHAQMVRDHGMDDVRPVTVQGVVLTSDGTIVLGVRGGFIQNGKVSMIPLGYVVAPLITDKDSNPLLQQFYTESEEELGINKDQYRKVELIGYQTDPKFTHGINFVVSALTSLSEKEVREIRDTSFRIYKEAHDRILNETSDKRKARSAAKQAVLSAGYKNCDIDHDPMIFARNGNDNIEQMISKGSLSHEERTFHLMALCRGGLRLYQKQIQE